MFIVFEGLDGCGKSTQIKLLENKLKEAGFNNVKTFREPGSTKISEDIREMLLNYDITDTQRLFLFLASRNAVVEEQIKPAIENGNIVLCDRYTPSTLAYQGYGKNVADILTIHQMNNIACENIQPDWVIFIDIPVEESIKRNNTYDKMEESVMNVYEKIYNGYKQLSKNNNWIVVDGMKSKDEISEEIFDIIKRKMNL